MTTQTLRHRAALRHLRAAPTRPQRRHRTRAAARLMHWLDRLSAAAWRLHDGMPAAWALLAAIVLTASIAIGIALFALAIGWTP